MKIDSDWLEWASYEGEADETPRLIAENPNDSDNTLTMAVSQSGRLIISVSDEQAVDSYNQRMECSIHIPKKLVPKLVEFLTKTFSEDRG